jgi:hypothetical protein
MGMMTAMEASFVATTLCGPRVYARLKGLVGETVEVVTLRVRYCGRLLAVHPRAVWVELSDDCRVAITETIVTVAHRPDAASSTEELGHPAMQAS